MVFRLIVTGIRRSSRSDGLYAMGVAKKKSFRNVILSLEHRGEKNLT